MADVCLPDWHPRAGQTAPVYAFAILHSAGVILFDTGIGPAHPVVDQLYRPQRFDLGSRLAAAGLRLADVTAVINSHLHFDHCGNNQLFPGKRVLVQALEREAADTPDYTIRELVDFPEAHYELVHGQAEPFPSVIVIPTPGHTPGHQSVALTDGDGIVIIAGQAAETAAEFQHPESITGENAAQRIESVQRLRALAPRRVYFSHDEQVWEAREARR